MNSPEVPHNTEASSLRSAEQRRDLKQKIPELLQLERLIRTYPQHLTARTELRLPVNQQELPLYSISLGASDTATPTLLLTGGMHGIERIGSQVLIAWLQTLLERLNWDSRLQHQLSQIQLVLMPILNPVGMYLNQRSNGNGVDLNRNAPVNAEDKVPLLGGGHRLGPLLPWYRGKKNNPMEAENIAFEKLVRLQILTHPFALAVDLHSGFGMRDQLWFPFAYRKKPIHNIADFVALKMLWERSYPNHNYAFEPQSIHYLSHGDMWDYFCLHARAQGTRFVPLTLEMGSWAWIKKRPRQIFNLAGLFNPQMQHRHARVLRSHLLLLDFMLAAALNHQNWLPDKKQIEILKQTAQSLWFK